MEPVRLSIILLLAVVCLPGLRAQQLITSPPDDIAVVSFLGETETPIPVQLSEGIEITGITSVAVTELPPDEMPPWAKAGMPWVESPKLKIASIAGKWVELVEVGKTGEPGVWIYLPTGVVYGDPEHVANYKRFTGK